MSEYGDFITRRRLKLGYSLRKFCLKFGYDPGNWSRHERGILKPFDPKTSAMTSLIKNLELDYLLGEELKDFARKELWPDKEEIRQLQSRLEKSLELNREAVELVDVFERVLDNSETQDGCLRNKILRLRTKHQDTIKELLEEK